MTRSRTIAWVGVAVSLAATAIGVAALAVRISNYNELNPRRAPYFQSIGVSAFDYRDRPVTIADATDAAGNDVVRVTYGQDIATIDVGVPNPLDLPGLARHADWLGVFLVGEPQGRTYAEFQQAIADGSVIPRLVLVSRHLNPGVDDSAFNLDIDENSREYGETMRNRWTFGFLELLPGGGFRQWTRTYPESERAFEGRTQAAILKGEPPPERDPDQLEEDSWEWYAALHVIPEGKAPNRTFRNGALTNAGWAFPVAALGVLGLIVSLAFALKPSRLARWDSASEA
jgi:hypothetical protein